MHLVFEEHDLGAEVMIPDFAIEHPDGRRAILKIVGVWTPEYVDAKLEKIRQVEADNFVLTVSERLDCASEEFGSAAERVLWFKTGIHVYDIVDLAEEHAVTAASGGDEAYRVIWGWTFGGALMPDEVVACGEMGLLKILRRSEGEEGVTHYECRNCGKTLPAEQDECPTCGSTEIAECTV